MALRPIYKFNAGAMAAPVLKNFTRKSFIDVQTYVVPLMKDALADFMALVVDETISTTIIKGKSGNLFSSLRKGIRITGTSMENLVGEYDGNEYAGIQEYGGKITPNHSRMLALPLPAALRPDGTPKLRGPLSWKQRYKTWVYHSKRTDKDYIVYKTKDGTWVFLYILVPSVKLKPLLGLGKTHNKMLPILLDTWSDIIVEGMLNSDIWGMVENPNQRLQLFAMGVNKTKRALGKGTRL